MPKTKPTLLARELWGRRVAVEVKIDSGGELRREIRGVRKALRSPVLSRVFTLVAKGTNTPTQIALLTGKSKYAVSLQLSQLKKAGLIKERPFIATDMRRKSYDIVWKKYAQIFQQDHALELEIYESRLSTENIKEIHGTINKTDLIIAGDGKLGLVREIVPDKPESIEANQQQVALRLNRLLTEFVQLFKGYLKERRFGTIREYLLGAYEELSQHYGRLPRSSELARFFEFLDRSFAKTQPIDSLWKRQVARPTDIEPNLYKPSLSRGLVIKLFAEAGSVDPARRYLLNADAQGIIKPGTVLRIYPSYSYHEQ